MWCRKKLIYTTVFILFAFSTLKLAADVPALEEQYRRNGEIYLLMSYKEVPAGDHTGVHRLSDPAGAGLYIGKLYEPGSSIGICVDLNRMIYTFTEDKSAKKYEFLPNMKLMRQVVDDSAYSGNLTRAQAIADYGYHAYWHADHRPENSTGHRAPVYRTGPAGRYVRATGQAVAGNGKWPTDASKIPAIKAQKACCQTYSSENQPKVAEMEAVDPPPSGVNPLPTIKVGNVKVQDPIEPGKQWYKIPNGSWYSTWQSKPTQSGSPGPDPDKKFYQVFGDFVEGKPRYWKLTTWDSNTKSPDDDPTIGDTVGTTYDIKISRTILAGCLDGCGGATGSGEGSANPMYVSVAFQPPMGGGQSRTYLYSREIPSPEYSLTLSVGGNTAQDYTPEDANPIIGEPFDMGSTPEKGTRWVGISLRDSTSDYVYTLSSALINRWYEEATPGTGDFSIDAIGVSNQWNQLGGIVYAYDKSMGQILKFTRNEKEGGITTQFEAVDVGNKVDAIAADGFGSLYYSRNAQDPEEADPRAKFETAPSYIYQASLLKTDDGSNEGVAFYEQKFNKTVYERNVDDGQTESKGVYPLGSTYYARRFVLPTGATIDLNKKNFEANMRAAGGEWAGWLPGLPSKKELKNGAKPPVVTYDPIDAPDHIELTVINVPTPPNVNRFEDAGRVDIAGPFTNYPVPSTTSTNQGAGLSQTATLNPKTPYFYMPENYPLFPNPVDPTSQPDWNDNEFMAGFVNTVEEGSVRYTWKLWTVGAPTVNHPENKPEVFVDEPPITESVTDPYFVFYSPVGGKYILTLSATFNWYDYTQLPFGGMYGDVHTDTGKYRADVRQEDEKAIGRPRSTLVAAVENAFSGSEIWPGLSSKLDTIIPVGGNTIAAIPINVSTDTPDIATDTLVAKIERCDDMTAPEADREWNGHDLEDGYNHGVFAGPATFGWCIEEKYLDHMFFDISTSNETRDTEANYNYVASRITNSDDPLYVNKDPLLRFANNVGDLKWDGNVVLTGVMYMAHGGQAVRLFGTDANPAVTVAQQKDAYGEAPIQIPSDPKFHRLTMTARRNFKYKVTPIAIITNPTTEEETEMPLSPIWLTNVMNIEAEALILGVDKSKPTLMQNQTNPRNIFGFTNQPLASGIGPDGKTNPANIYFQLSDNNPWENSSETGVSKEDSADNRIHNDGYASDKTSEYNLKPVFSKENRSASLKYEFITAPSQYAAPVGLNTQLLSGSNIFVAKNTPGADTQTDSYLGFTVALSEIGYGNIAKNYANNTPGYQPYKFDVIATDSSGNSESYKLNLVLNVRDNVPPIPWVTMIDGKTDERSLIPAIADLPQSGYQQLPFELMETITNAESTATTWNPGNNGNIPGITGRQLRALPQKSAAVVAPAATGDVEAVAALVQQGIPPNFLEDSVEFSMYPFGTDNAGGATATVTVGYLDAVSGDAKTWSSQNSTTRNAGTLAPNIATGGALLGFFRGLPGDFPMFSPVVITAEDDARDWNYFVSDDGSANWTWPDSGPGPKLNNANPAMKPNTRTLNTMLLIYDSRMRIRTLDSRQQK